VITDGRGIPLAATLTGGNRHDVTQLIPLIEAIPPVRGRRGRPRRRPVKVFADRAYDHDKYRRLVQAKLKLLAMTFRNRRAYPRRAPTRRSGRPSNLWSRRLDRARTGLSAWRRPT
jgi:hypothetical protein